MQRRIAHRRSSTPGRVLASMPGIAAIWLIVAVPCGWTPSARAQAGAGDGLSTAGVDIEAGDPAQSSAPEGRTTTAVRLVLEGGSEYDTNIHRLEAADTDTGSAAGIEASPILRGGTRITVDWRPRMRQRLVLAGIGSGKLYGRSGGQGENVAIVAGDGRYERRLAGRSAVLGASLRYCDMFHFGKDGARAMDEPPLPEPRHFSTADGELSMALAGPGEHRMVLSGGFRRFRYKPNASFDWYGDHYGLRFRAVDWRKSTDDDLYTAALELTVSYELERRHYLGNAFTNVCGEGVAPEPTCFSPMGIGRVDLRHLGGAELVYTGERIYGARYQLEVTDSNSFGQSLVRQRLELGLTFELLARVVLTAKLALQLDIFPDSLLLARDVQAQDFTTIDDENRNSFSLHLARDVNQSWSAEARYALYRSEFASDEPAFRRQIFYLGAVYRYAP